MADSKKIQQFLDNGQYSKHGLEKYEWIFGETFLSTGGKNTTSNVLKHIRLNDDAKVLDLGSGLGGHSFLIAETFGADVIGIDLSNNMVEIARKHLKNRPHLKDKVTFEITDCTQTEFPENHFDLIYSRDALLHIQDKRSLFKNLFKWLKPSGYILFTDYVRGDEENNYSEEFKSYLKQRGYHLETIKSYETILESCGFKDVRILDWKEEFVNALNMELKKLRDGKEEFLKTFTQEDYNDLESGWLQKLRRADQKNQGWILGYGRKQMS